MGLFDSLPLLWRRVLRDGIRMWFDILTLLTTRSRNRNRMRCRYKRKRKRKVNKNTTLRDSTKNEPHEPRLALTGGESFNERVTVFRNVNYGRSQANEMQCFDLYYPTRLLDDGKPPLPAIVWIHGGGFYVGSKNNYGEFNVQMEEVISSGMAFLSFGYRLITAENGLTMMAGVNDCLRALQFARYHSGQLGINPSRIGVYGLSAGAACSVMIGLGDDRRDPMSDDLVARESTRVAAIGLTWMANIDVATDDLETQLREKGLVDAEDPPVHIYQPKTDLLHHADHAFYLVDFLEAAGVEHVANITEGGGVLYEAGSRPAVDTTGGVGLIEWLISKTRGSDL